MKNNYLFILILSIAWGCNDKNESDAFGNFEANPVIVSAETTGKILHSDLKQGLFIDSGEMVAVIDTTQAFLQIQQLIAQKEAVRSKQNNVNSQIAVYKEQIKNLEINENRIKQMLEDGAATQKQLDDISGQINVIEKQIENANTQFISINKELEVIETQITTIKEQFNRCFVKNPVKGTVLETYIEEGEITTTGKALYKIANTDELILKVYVSGAQLSSVKIGQLVSVFIDKNETENQELPGIVSWISPEAEFTPKIIQTKEERVKLVYAVKVNVKNDGRLKIGMPGEINY